MSRLVLAGLFAAVSLVGCNFSTDPLPGSLYFIQGREAEAQVWRLERDGVTLEQVTHEAAGVSEYAVSPEDGTLAIVSQNQLLLMDADGGNRRLLADGSQVDPNIEDYVFRSSVSSPIFSPDGQTLAYGFDGLHLYDLGTGVDDHVLTNLGNLLGEPFVFSREVYVPWRWSPDGSQLLIIMGYYEGDTLAIMEPGLEQPFRRLWSDGPVCCIYAWSTDGREVLAANPHFTVQIPGLWRYDAGTGEEEVVIPGINPDNSLNFIGWPHQLASGELLFFYVNQMQFSPDEGIPLRLAGSEADGSAIHIIRNEEFRIVDVLWDPDGSMAIIINYIEDGDWQMVLMPSDDSPLQVLVQASSIRRPAWGP